MFCRPAATPEQECHKAPAALGTQVAVYEDSIGQLILQWLRKPTYWSEGSSGTQALWHAYTPESVTPSELALSRQACGVACDAQPVIKGTLPNRDIAHMAATSLGYLTWGVTNDPMDYGLGDLGGWALDLLQIWGSADNLVIAFRKLVDGIDLGIFDNVSGSKKALLIASHADRLPSQAEAGILALSYAESLENPNR